MLVVCNDIADTENNDKTITGLSSSDVSRLSHSELMAEALLNPNNLGLINPGTDQHLYATGAFNLSNLVLERNSGDE